jgi:hypothetical protein
MDGIVYVAYGDDYLDMAVASALSVKQYSKIPTAIFCDREGIDLIKVDIPNAMYGDRAIKTQLYKYSPFDKTLYLDCDTLIDSYGIEDIFNYNAIGMCEAFNPLNEFAIDLESQYTWKLLPDNFIQYNTGVILFDKSNESSEIFDTWYHEWLRFGTRDNLALHRAIASRKIEIDLLPRSYNHLYSQSGKSIVTHYADLFGKTKFWEDVNK